MGPRLRSAICLLLTGALGAASLFYRGPGSAWISTHLGGFFYVPAWIFLILTLFPRASIAWVSLGACAGTCALEFLQLWDPPLLHSIRATFVGRIVLGSTFSWADFPWYGLGGLAGWSLARSVADRSRIPDCGME